MDMSVFTDRAITPTDSDLARELGPAFDLWRQLRDFVMEKYPQGRQEWTYPGKKFGWSFRIKDKKRAIIYLLPRKMYFKVAFVFGQKATDTILQLDIIFKFWRRISTFGKLINSKRKYFPLT